MSKIQLIEKTPRRSSYCKHARRVRGVRRPRYALRRGFKVWQLIFEGEIALIQHEAGVVHVAWLLAHPGAEPIHALDLAGRAVIDRAEEKRGLASGLPANAVVRQRSLTMENSSAARAVWRKQRELESVLEDELESEHVKAEAQRELDELMSIRTKHLRRAADDSSRTAHAVRRSIRRLYHRLARAVDAEGRPHRVLRAFAAHLEIHLLLPSRRWAGSRTAGDYPGCLVYEPPEGVVWVCD